MDRAHRNTIVLAIAAKVPSGKWFTPDAIAQLTGFGVHEVIEILDDEANAGEIDERRVHDDHTLYRIPVETDDDSPPPESWHTDNDSQSEPWKK